MVYQGLGLMSFLGGFVSHHQNKYLLNIVCQCFTSPKYWGSNFQQMFEGDVKPIPKMGHLPTPVKGDGMWILFGGTWEFDGTSTQFLIQCHDKYIYIYRPASSK